MSGTLFKFKLQLISFSFSLCLLSLINSSCGQLNKSKTNKEEPKDQAVPVSSNLAPKEQKKLKDTPILFSGKTGHNTCAIYNKKVLCWGDPSSGKNKVPKHIINPTNIAVGHYDICAVYDEGKIDCWGNGGIILSNAPKNIKNIKVFTMGALEAFIIDEKDNLYSFGRGFMEETLPEYVKNVKLIDLGWQHACALYGKGRVYCWGFLNVLEPIHDVEKFEDATDLSTSDWVVCVIHNNGKLKCLGNRSSLKYIPTDISNATQVAVAERIGCVIQDNRKIKCWKDNEAYNIDNLTKISTAKKLFAGAAHICAIYDDDNKVACAGHPELIKVPEGIKNVKQLVTGSTHTCVVYEDSKVACWGSNDYGELNIPAELLQ